MKGTKLLNKFVIYGDHGNKRIEVVAIEGYSGKVYYNAKFIGFNELKCWECLNEIREGDNIWILFKVEGNLDKGLDKTTNLLHGIVHWECYRGLKNYNIYGVNSALPAVVRYIIKPRIQEKEK